MRQARGTYQGADVLEGHKVALNERRQALNAAIEHLQRTEPTEGSAIAGIIGELEDLAGRVIENETSLKLDPIKAQLDEAVARAEELLATRRVTS